MTKSFLPELQEAERERLEARLAALEASLVPLYEAGSGEEPLSPLELEESAS